MSLVLGMFLALLLPSSVHAQRMLETVNLPQSAEPIKFTADHIATWEQKGHHVLLLRGNVQITQGETSFRAGSAAAWVDMQRYEQERVFHVVVYGEDGIELTHKTSVQADYGYVKLATTNNRIDIRPFKSKVIAEDYSHDQGYRRALANQPPGLGLPRQPEKGQAPRIEELRPAPVPPVQPAEFRVEEGSLPGVMPVTATYMQIPPKVEPVPGVPNEAPPPPIYSPTPPPPPAPNAAPKQAPRISIYPRMGRSLNIQYKPVENNTTAVIVTGGVTLLVTSSDPTVKDKPTTLDIEADRAVIWTRGNAQQLFGGARAEGIEQGAHEIYMSGNVEIRTRTKNEVETLRADEIYYDVRRGVAVARQAELEILHKKAPYPINLTGVEIRRENEKLYKIQNASVFSSLLPSDPGLRVDISDVTIEERQIPKRGFLGLYPAYDKNGQPITETQRMFTGRNMVAALEGVPIFYFPYLRGRVEDPLGPLDNVLLGYNQIFGFQIHTTWDVFDLLNMSRPEGQRWRVMLDYLTSRGPFAGTEYDFAGGDLFGTGARYSGLVKLYGGYDRRQDTLGGDRGNRVFFPDELTSFPVTHPDFRGWAHGKVNVQNLPAGFSVLGEMNFLTDRNFLEQYYLNTHLNDLNQDTYLYVKQQQEVWAWTLLGQVRTRDWITGTDWLPKAEGHLLGRTFLDDLLVYNARASLGYGRLRPTEEPPFAYLPNDVRRDAGRFDLWQELSLPFYLGPVKLAPYVVGDVAYYTEDVSGDDRGRLYGGAGVRANMPLSRFFPEIQSELFNLDGIYHKINLVGNYHVAQANAGFAAFPMFDRVNDDATDQALRDIRPLQKTFNPNNAAFLTTSGIVNPQSYMVRRLIDSNVDTFDDIHVLQFGVRQRWQTRRGFPGREHVVDWMTFDIGASVFPQADRDNFGRTWGIIEYDWTWNIGDRTALTSSGWAEPFGGGPRVFDFGLAFERPDGTRLYGGYRQIDPLESKAVVASIMYPLSAKYAFTASTVWDFGTDVTSYSILFSRMGTDVMFNFGLNYNSTLSTIGVVVELLPNLARRSSRARDLFPMTSANIDPMVNADRGPIPR